MTQVSKKDNREPLENLLRRFNRKVNQSGVLSNARQRQYFEKPPTKKERREAAIRRRRRKEAKTRRALLGRR